MTVPNLITCLRIILTPIFVIALLQDADRLALAIFGLAALSDGVDGFVARVFNQKSVLGAYLDPLADKFLLVAAFAVLAISGRLPSWLAVTVIARDILILAGLMIILLGGSKPFIHPSLLSKLTTCLQILSILAVLTACSFDFTLVFSGLLFRLTGLFTVASGLHYMFHWFRIIGLGNLSQ